MKKIRKKDLFELARMRRKYRTAGDVDALEFAHYRAKELSTQAFGVDSRWLAFSDFVSSLVGVLPLANTTNEQLVKLFEVIGYEVVDDDTL